MLNHTQFKQHIANKNTIQKAKTQYKNTHNTNQHNFKYTLQKHNTKTKPHNTTQATIQNKKKNTTQKKTQY